MEGTRVEMTSDCVEEFSWREGVGQEVLWMSGGVRTFHAREHAYAERCATRSEPSHVLSDEWFVAGGTFLEDKDGLEACFRTGEGKFSVLSVEETPYAIVNLRHGQEVPAPGVFVIYEATCRVTVIRAREYVTFEDLAGASGGRGDSLPVEPPAGFPWDWEFGESDVILRPSRYWKGRNPVSLAREV